MVSHVEECGICSETSPCLIGHYFISCSDFFSDLYDDDSDHYITYLRVRHFKIILVFKNNRKFLETFLHRCNNSTTIAHFIATINTVPSFSFSKLGENCIICYYCFTQVFLLGLLDTESTKKFWLFFFQLRHLAFAYLSSVKILLHLCLTHPSTKAGSCSSKLVY